MSAPMSTSVEDSRRLKIVCLTIALTFLFLISFSLMASQVLAAGAFDVRDYGATAGDSSDDSAAFQKAISAAAAQAGTVSVPAGTYVIKSPLSLASGIQMVGTPGQSILTMPAKTSIAFILNGTSLSNVTISGLSFRAGSYTDHVAGIYMVGAQNCRATNLRFDNLEYAMKLGSGPVARGWVVEDITARGCRQGIFGSYVEDSSFTGLDLQAINDPTTNKGHVLYLERENHH